jgi:hypothetical protein
LQEGAFGDCSHENLGESFDVVLIRVGGHEQKTVLRGAAIGFLVVRGRSIKHIFNPFETIP